MQPSANSYLEDSQPARVKQGEHVITGRDAVCVSHERWAADRIVSQHRDGRCAQCSDEDSTEACLMHIWARAVVAGQPAAYPMVAPASQGLCS